MLLRQMKVLNWTDEYSMPFTRGPSEIDPNVFLWVNEQTFIIINLYLLIKIKFNVMNGNFYIKYIVKILFTNKQ